MTIKEFPCERANDDLDLIAQAIIVENIRRGSGQPKLPREEILSRLRKLPAKSDR